MTRWIDRAAGALAGALIAVAATLLLSGPAAPTQPALIAGSDGGRPIGNPDIQPHDETRFTPGLPSVGDRIQDLRRIEIDEACADDLPRNSIARASIIVVSECLQPVDE